MDGGFEGQTVGPVPDIDASATTPTTNWTKGITTTNCAVPVTTSISGSGGRTGSKYAVVNVNCTSVNRQLISPQLYNATTYPTSTDGTYTFQYWVRNSSNIGASLVGVGTATAVGMGNFVANTTSTWTKQTVTVTPSTPVLEEIGNGKQKYVFFKRTVVTNNVNFEPGAALPENVINLDSFGDIILEKEEVALFRGGWQDRDGATVLDDAKMGEMAALSIYFDEPAVPNTIFSRVQAQNRKAL